MLLVDNIGPFKPPSTSAILSATDNPGCQGLSWPLNLSDPELTFWSKDPHNPLSINNLPCGTRPGSHSRGAFPGSIWQNGDHYNYLSFGYRFTTNDSSLHEWKMVPEQMLSNQSAQENGGQWFLRTPSPLNKSRSTPALDSSASSRPTHMVSCTGGPPREGRNGAGTRGRLGTRMGWISMCGATATRAPRVPAILLDAPDS